MKDQERGTALLLSAVLTVVAVGLTYSALSIAESDRSDVKLAEQRLQARYAAEAGLHHAARFVNAALSKGAFQPFQGLDALPYQDHDGDPLTDPIFLLAREEPIERNGRTYASFSCGLALETDGDQRRVTVTSTGSVPGAQGRAASATLEAVLETGLGPSEVFDYSYFINNWGWFYGNTIFASGNVRSNGQFDADGYSPTIEGTPRYQSNDNGVLGGYQDDNGDGLQDGLDGGIFSGWDIVNAGNVQGPGGDAQNQQEFLDPVSMPNLSDLGPYETLALDHGSSIDIGATQATGPVLGDDPGEPEHLCLIGTATDPIVLDGPVVVRGNVIIKGYVTGQGAIYAGGNVYVADDLVYLNPPSTAFPADRGQAATETWLAANAGADFLGLFAGENIVMGDYTNSTWQYYVDWWLSHSMNESSEDSGSDGIPNTACGRDGTCGTEDDDVLEGDGLWTVDTYTEADQLLGLIPPGFSVGDAVPGSGEDIDGDGQPDDTLGISDLALDVGLGSSLWGGNMPSGVSSFSELSSVQMTHIDGALYTNHAAALLTLAGGEDFHFYGSIVSRNESLIYGTDSMHCDYDRRLLGGGLYENLLPKTLSTPRIVAYRIVAGSTLDLELNP